MAEPPFVCIIGAGASGLAAAKALRERGIPFDCFEQRDRVGGLWAFGGAGSPAAAYRSLRTNTSRRRMQFSDLPMPAWYPDFPHHTQIAAYFEAYVDHFGLRQAITFNTAVTRAERRPDGLWRVTLGAETRLYDALVVANGHHWDPRWPSPPLPGRFDGLTLHSRDYVDHTPLLEQDVVVLGLGNSAADIAVESSFVARHTYLSMRRGAHVVPKYLLGRPIDHLKTNPRLPWPLRRRLRAAAVRLLVGRMETYGLPTPDHRLGEAHPTISSYLLPRLADRAIIPKPAIVELLGDRVRFADDTIVPAQVLIYCTGYNVTFPFFDAGFIAASDNDLPLFKRVFRPGLDNLFFVGLAQPIGALTPLVEAQSRWIADYLLGRYALPGPDEMRADMERARVRLARRVVPSARHTMEVEVEDYLYDLDKERRRGAARARRQGPSGAVAARAMQGAAAR